MKNLLPCLCLLASLTVSPLAHALPTFPGIVQETLAIAEAPDCSLCHNGAPSTATANTAFVEKLRTRGFKNDAGSLPGALRALEGEMDSTIATLKGGGPVPTSSESSPEYGCAATAAPASGSGLAGVLVALGLLAQRRRSRG